MSDARPSSVPTLRELLSFPNIRIFSKAEECEVVFNDERHNAYVVATGSYDAYDDHAEDYFVVIWHGEDGLVCAKTKERRYCKHIESGLLHFKELPEELQKKITSSRRICRRSELGRDYRTVLPRQVITVIDPSTMQEFGLSVTAVSHEIDPYDDCHESLIFGTECDCGEKIVLDIHYNLSFERSVELAGKGYKVITCEPHHIS